jgi:crossover junction endodeoxyribonuclease RusA
MSALGNPRLGGAGGRQRSSPVRRADGAVPAGPRSYTIALPAGLALLSLNDRGHWAARYRRSEALKKAAWALALQQRIPRLERVSVTVEYQPRDLRRRDGDNIAASAKALIDGLRAAGVLPEDDSRHVTEVTCRIGALYPKGRLVLTLTEVATAGSEAS